MNRIDRSFAFAVAMAATALLVLGALAGTAQADLCFLCTSDSTDTCKDKNYCKSASGNDTSDDRKKCKAKGCKVGGTASCPSSDSKVCKASVLNIPGVRGVATPVVVAMAQVGSASLDTAVAVTNTIRDTGARECAAAPLR